MPSSLFHVFADSRRKNKKACLREFENFRSVACSRQRVFQETGYQAEYLKKTLGIQKVVEMELEKIGKDFKE